jgi:hypothetical protein
MTEITAKFCHGPAQYTVSIDGSLIVIAHNDNPAANFSVWSAVIKAAALIALADAVKK